MRRTGWLLILVCLATATSCIRFHGPEDLRRDLARAAGVKLDRERGLTLTRTGVMLVRWATSEERIPLRGVRRVEVGIYQVQGLRRGVEQRRPIAPPQLPGWQNIVRVRDDGDEVFVLVREEDEEIREMLVIVAEEDEWVLVRIRGQLQDTIESALQLAFDRAERPELYEPVLAEYRSEPVSPGRTGSSASSRPSPLSSSLPRISSPADRRGASSSRTPW